MDVNVIEQPIELVAEDGEIILEIGGTYGEVNTGVNLADGDGAEAIYAGKVGTELQFKTLRAGTNIAITSTDNEVHIANTQSVPVTSVFGRIGDVAAQNSDYSAFYDANGAASNSMASHIGAADPHVQYAKHIDLSIVATTGNYSDLNGLPTIVTAHSQLTEIGTNTHPQIDTALADFDKRISNALSTTLLEGGKITVNGGGLTINISAGTAVFVDNYTDSTNPVRTLVEFGPFTNITPSYLTTADGTFFAIDVDGNLTQTDYERADEEICDFVELGWVEHTNRVNVSTFLNEPYQMTDLGVQVQQFWSALGAFNQSGNVYHGNANLTVGRTAGEIFDNGTGRDNDPRKPNDFYTVDIATVTFRYYYRDGAGDWFNNNPDRTAIDPDHYDDGTGTLALVPSNYWTIQPLYLYAPSESNDFQYGQKTYATKDLALADLNAQIELNSFVADYDILRAYLIVKQGATDISNTNQAQFINVSKFGSASSSGGGGGSGEVNTASNVGTQGVGFYNSKVGVDLQFKNLEAASSKLTVTDYPTNHTVRIDLGTVTKSDVGLGNVDNTTDANKPVSTAQATAIGLKADKTTTVNGHALSSNVTVTAADVGAYTSGAVDTLLTSKVSTSTTVNGHALSANVSVTATDVGLGNCDNTSDANKPVSTATQTALNGKVSTSRTVNGHALSSDVTVTATDVGLGSVTNDAQLKISSNLSDLNNRQTSLNTITAVSGATNEYVLTKDTGTGNAIWKAGGAGSSTWGSITGTLSNQTDLQTALNKKSDIGLALVFSLSYSGI